MPNLKVLLILGQKIVLYDSSERSLDAITAAEKLKIDLYRR